jgi:hypothetical protein
MFLFIWDILFSPFGAQRRLTNGFLLVAMLYALKDSSMVLRSRLAPAAPLPVQESWAEQVMRPLDQRAALGLAEPEAPAWRGASPDDAEAEALDADDAWTQDPDEDDQPFDERDERFDQDSRYAPDDGAAADDDAYDIDGQEVDSEEFGENDVDADQIGGKEHGDLSGGPSDAGDGGETIRAGFRRLRQRNQ